MICRSLSLETQAGEKWRPVAGYEGIYEISNLGRVKSLSRDSVDSLGRHRCLKEHIMKLQIQHQTGYPYVGLAKDGKSKQGTIHRMIAEAFLPNPNNLPCVNHKDEDRENSILSNLEWCSYSYNACYHNDMRVKNETRYKNNGSRKICQYTKEGVLVRTYDMWPRDFWHKYGIKIQGCLNHNKATAGGYVWRYEGDPFSNDLLNIHGPQMIVEMYDNDNNLVKTFDGVTRMLKELGTCKQTFNGSKDENGLFHYKGYTFKKIRKAETA